VVLVIIGNDHDLEPAIITIVARNPIGVENFHRSGLDWPSSVIVHKPQREGETLCRVVMDNISEAPLNVTYGAGADAGALCQLVLGHPGR
jgi:hypothetical protein